MNPVDNNGHFKQELNWVYFLPSFGGSMVADQAGVFNACRTLTESLLVMESDSSTGIDSIHIDDCVRRLAQGELTQHKDYQEYQERK